MIWINCIFGLLFFTVITCSPAISHGKSIRLQRSVPGGVVDKNPNDPKYLKLAELAIKKYASDVGTDQEYVVIQVKRATEQVVAGLLTEIDFSAVVSFCLTLDCPLLSCHSRIVEQSWLGKKDISVSCGQPEHV